MAVIRAFGWSVVLATLVLVCPSLAKATDISVGSENLSFENKLSYEPDAASAEPAGEDTSTTFTEKADYKVAKTDPATAESTVSDDYVDTQVDQLINDLNANSGNYAERERIYQEIMRTIGDYIGQLDLGIGYAARVISKYDEFSALLNRRHAAPELELETRRRIEVILMGLTSRRSDRMLAARENPLRKIAVAMNSTEEVSFLRGLIEKLETAVTAEIEADSEAVDSASAHRELYDMMLSQITVNLGDFHCEPVLMPRAIRTYREGWPVTCFPDPSLYPNPDGGVFGFAFDLGGYPFREAYVWRRPLVTIRPFHPIPTDSASPVSLLTTTFDLNKISALSAAEIYELMFATGVISAELHDALLTMPRSWPTEWLSFGRHNGTRAYYEELRENSPWYLSPPFEQYPFSDQNTFVTFNVRYGERSEIISALDNVNVTEPWGQSVSREQTLRYYVEDHLRRWIFSRSMPGGILHDEEERLLPLVHAAAAERISERAQRAAGVLQEIRRTILDYNALRVDLARTCVKGLAGESLDASVEDTPERIVVESIETFLRERGFTIGTRLPTTYINFGPENSSLHIRTDVSHTPYGAVSGYFTLYLDCLQGAELGPVDFQPLVILPLNDTIEVTVEIPSATRAILRALAAQAGRPLPAEGARELTVPLQLRDVSNSAPFFSSDLVYDGVSIASSLNTPADLEEQLLRLAGLDFESFGSLASPPGAP